MKRRISSPGTGPRRTQQPHFPNARGSAPWLSSGRGGRRNASHRTGRIEPRSEPRREFRQVWTGSLHSTRRNECVGGEIHAVVRCQLALCARSAGATLHPSSDGGWARRGGSVLDTLGERRGRPAARAAANGTVWRGPRGQGRLVGAPGPAYCTPAEKETLLTPSYGQ
jgi:hypothetical protein